MSTYLEGWFVPAKDPHREYLDALHEAMDRMERYRKALVVCEVFAKQMLDRKDSSGRQVCVAEILTAVHNALDSPKGCETR